MRRAYHGSTHGAMSMMGAPEGEEWKGAFRPLLPDVQAIEFNDFGELERITRRTACVVVRTRAGRSGRTPAGSRCSRRCGAVATKSVRCSYSTNTDRHGAHGSAVRHAQIRCYARHRVPGQGIRGGMPLGAFASRPEIMQTLQENPVLGHITTFGGHPVCCAAGLAALNYLLDNKVVEGVEAKGTHYAQLLGNDPAVREIRRSGLLLAVELGEPQKLYRIMELFKQAGILSDWFLFCDTAFRISPPLTISEEEIRGSAALILKCPDELG